MRLTETDLLTHKFFSDDKNSLLQVNPKPPKTNSLLNSKARSETRLNRRAIVTKRVVVVNENALISLIFPRVVTGPFRGVSGQFSVGIKT